MIGERNRIYHCTNVETTATTCKIHTIIPYISNTQVKDDYSTAQSPKFEGQSLYC